jgi:hypothetical protein
MRPIFKGLFRNVEFSEWFIVATVILVPLIATLYTIIRWRHFRPDTRKSILWGLGVSAAFVAMLIIFGD